MNLSNISCEYFYDEEYDLGERNFTTDSSNSNNNNDSSFCDQSNTFWAESVLATSGNNNVTDSYLFEKNFRAITKCLSSDQVIDTSVYSLNQNDQYLTEKTDDNYHRLFNTSKTEIFDLNYNIDINQIKRHFTRKSGSKFFIDSGKGSVTTCDSMIQPIRFCQENIIKSEENIAEASLKKSSLYKRKKPIILWRNFKKLFSNPMMSWSKTTYRELKRSPISYSMPNLTVCSFNTDSLTGNKNRYSTTILELYNLILDIDSETLDEISISSYNKIEKNLSDFSCQFPEKIDKVKVQPRKKKLPESLDYPRLGRVKTPNDLRTTCDELMSDRKMCFNLNFLTKSLNIRRSKSSVNRTLFEEAKYQEKIKNKCLKRSSSESKQLNLNNQPEVDKSKVIVRMDSDLEPITEEIRCHSFADLRPIPRKTGLSNPNNDDIMAIFEVGVGANYKKNSIGSLFARQQPMTIKELTSEEEITNRLGDLVNSTLESLKKLSKSPEDIGTMCDKFFRFKDSRRESTTDLVIAIDSVLALISDGLCVGSSGISKSNQTRLKSNKSGISSRLTPEEIERKRNGQVAQKLWIFVEESCRGVIKEPSQKMALATLMKQVKQQNQQLPITASRDVVYQLRLQLFITAALKKGLLSIWLRAVVSNEQILNRFFSPNSFLRQARTVLSNALSAVVVEVRNLTGSVPSTQLNFTNKNKSAGASRITKPVTVRAGRSRIVKSRSTFSAASTTTTASSRPITRSSVTRTNSQSKHSTSRTRFSLDTNMTNTNTTTSSGGTGSRASSRSKIPVLVK